MRCWLLLLFVGVALGASLSEERTRALFELCLTDSECRTLYGQTKGQDYRLFEHLARREVSERALSLMNGEARADDAERVASVLMLNNIRHDSIDSCTTNQVPVLDPDSGTVDCVCLEDRDCNPSGDTQDFSITVLLVLIALMEALSLASEIYRFYGGGATPSARSRKGK